MCLVYLSVVSSSPKKSIAISTWSWLVRLQVYSSNGIFSRHCGSSAPTQGYHERSRAAASAWGGTCARAVLGRAELVSAPQNSEGPWYQHIAASRPHVVAIASSGCIKSISILGHGDGYGVFEWYCRSQATPIFPQSLVSVGLMHDDFRSFQSLTFF